jgi:hypothetical protein
MLGMCVPAVLPFPKAFSSGEGGPSAGWWMRRGHEGKLFGRAVYHLLSSVRKWLGVFFSTVKLCEKPLSSSTAIAVPLPRWGRLGRPSSRMDASPFPNTRITVKMPKTAKVY